MKTFCAGKTTPANCSVPAPESMSTTTSNATGGGGGGNNVSRLNPASNANSTGSGSRIADYRDSNLSPSLNLSGQPQAAAIQHSQSRSSSNGSSTPPSPIAMPLADMESPTEAEAYETPGVSPSQSMISALEYQHHPRRRCESLNSFECPDSAVLRSDSTAQGSGGGGTDAFYSHAAVVSRSRVRRLAVRARRIENERPSGQSRRSYSLFCTSSAFVQFAKMIFCTSIDYLALIN